VIERAKQMLGQVDAWLRRHRYTRIARRAALGFLQHEALQNAGSMAYFSILSLFQLLVLAVVVLSFFVGHGEARDFVIEQIQLATPVDPDTIGDVIDGIIETRGGVSIFGLIFLIWGALGIFSAISKGIGSAFVSAQPRPFIQDKLIGLFMISVTGVLGITSVVIGLVTGIIQEAAADVLATIPGGSLALGTLGFALPLVLIFAAFLVLYRVVPNRPVSLSEVWPGAVVATVLWTALRVGFTWYTTSVAKYNSAFGPISAAISLLVFLYFASVIVLLGAEVARANVLEDELGRSAPAVPRTDEPAAESPASAAAEPESGSHGPSHEGPRPVAVLPGWAMAIGAAAAGFVVRWLSRRRRD
jgi:membrane protein